jgi:DNA-binding LacI/PurR family transcriptional regulator
MDEATIYDVARKAGVSIATVSRVLNNSDRVKPETRALILSTIDSLKFVPKAEAVTRARKSGNRIGIITPSVTDDPFVDRLRGIMNALDGTAYETVLYPLKNPSGCNGIMAKLALNRSVDALIVFAGSALDEKIIKRFAAHNIPLVIGVDKQTTFDCSVNQILIDHGAGARMAADYLVEKGHRKIAFVGDAYPDDGFHPLGRVKLDTFRQRLAENGIPLPDGNVLIASQSIEQGYEKGQSLLMRSELPTAIFASSDTQAIGIISAAQERGMSIPDDIAVIGFDDISIAEYMKLTTINQALKDSGRLAVEFVLAAMESKVSNPQCSELPLRLIPRKTA